MLPSTIRRKQHDSGWMLLPKKYIYIGSIVCFFFGCLLGSGWKQMTYMTLNNSNDYKYTNKNGLPTVLVTGGLGFIGSHVVEDLIENNFNVIIYDDMSNGNNFNKKVDAFLLRDITIINDFNYIQQKVDYIIHLAAAISVAESTKLPEKYERINVEGSRKVFDWARINNVKKVVAASSAACYGIPTKDMLPLTENTANGGICPYSQTKYKMEKIMNEYGTLYNLNSIALRFFNVYGPRQDPKSDYSGVVSWFMDQAKILYGKGIIKITGDGTQYRDFIYVKDVARSIRLAMLFNNNNKFDVFNVCTGKKTTIFDLANQIVKTFNTGTSITYVEPRPGDVNESICNPNKAKDILGFESKYTLETGIQDTHDWFLTI